MDEICPVCEREKPAQDMRTLRINYNWAFGEVSDKFEIKDGSSFQITTCKDCRGDFVGLIRLWVNGAFKGDPEFDELDPDRCIPVMVDGRIVMKTHEEWELMRVEDESRQAEVEGDRHD